MPLGTEVGLGQGHIVLDEDPTQKGAQQPPSLFGPVSTVMVKRLDASAYYLVRR